MQQTRDMVNVMFIGGPHHNKALKGICINCEPSITPPSSVITSTGLITRLPGAMEFSSSAGSGSNHGGRGDTNKGSKGYGSSSSSSSSSSGSSGSSSGSSGSSSGSSGRSETRGGSSFSLDPSLPAFTAPEHAIVFTMPLLRVASSAKTTAKTSPGKAGGTSGGMGSSRDRDRDGKCDSNPSSFFLPCLAQFMDDNEEEEDGLGYTNPSLTPASAPAPTSAPTPAPTSAPTPAPVSVSTGMAVALHGNSAAAYLHLSRLAWPALHPSLGAAPFTDKVPDYMVIGKGVWQRGAGAILAAGFWSTDWRLQDQAFFAS